MAVVSREGLLTAGEAAVRLRVSRRELLALRRQGGPMPIRGEMGEPLYDPVEIAEWSATHRIARDLAGNMIRAVPVDAGPAPSRAEEAVSGAREDPESLVAVWRAAERLRLEERIGGDTGPAKRALWAALDAHNAAQHTAGDGFSEVLARLDAE